MAAYTGMGAEKISYKGVVHSWQGLFTGEIPALPGIVSLLKNVFLNVLALTSQLMSLFGILSSPALPASRS